MKHAHGHRQVYHGWIIFLRIWQHALSWIRSCLEGMFGITIE